MSNGSDSPEKTFEELVRRVVREEMAAGAGGAGNVTLSPAPVPPQAAKAPSGFGYRALNESLSEILQPTSQADILGATLHGIVALAGRCALFVRRGDSFTAWRAEGYSGLTAASLRAVSVSATQPGIFKELCDTQRSICRQRVSGILPPALEQALGSAVGPHLCLLPVIVQGKVVAALYSDAGGVAGSEEMSGLEIVARVAGLSLETAASRPTQGAAAAQEVTAEPMRSETLPPALAMAETPADGQPPRGSFATSFHVASESAQELPPPPDADTLPEAERDSHRKAHRFARVAVQDLLSYHREKIDQARRNRNLFTVLQEDIEKTRENYQKRFGQTPARAFDYLHYEMVSKLAGNDLTVLGEMYPGPWAGE